MTKQIQLGQYLYKNYTSEYKLYYKAQVKKSLIFFTIALILVAIFKIDLLVFYIENNLFFLAIIAILFSLVYVFIFHILITYLGMPKVAYSIIRKMEEEQQRVKDDIKRKSGKIREWEYIKSSQKKRNILKVNAWHKGDILCGAATDLIGLTDDEIDDKFKEFISSQEAFQSKRREKVEDFESEIKNLHSKIT